MKVTKCVIWPNAMRMNTGAKVEVRIVYTLDIFTPEVVLFIVHVYDFSGCSMIFFSAMHVTILLQLDPIDHRITYILVSVDACSDWIIVSVAQLNGAKHTVNLCIIIIGRLPAGCHFSLHWRYCSAL